MDSHGPRQGARIHIALVELTPEAFGRFRSQAADYRMASPL
jgi:hypothetical protein